jgi:hypothetical protein
MPWELKPRTERTEGHSPTVSDVQVRFGRQRQLFGVR